MPFVRPQRIPFIPLVSSVSQAGERNLGTNEKTQFEIFSDAIILTRKQPNYLILNISIYKKS